MNYSCRLRALQGKQTCFLRVQPLGGLPGTGRCRELPWTQLEGAQWNLSLVGQVGSF